MDNPQISVLMKILSVETEFVYAGGQVDGCRQTGRRTGMSKLIVAFHKIANSSYKSSSQINTWFLTTIFADIINICVYWKMFFTCIL